MPVVDCLLNENVSKVAPSTLTCIQVPSTIESLNRMSSNIVNGSANDSGMPFIGSWLLLSKYFCRLISIEESFNCFLVHLLILIFPLNEHCYLYIVVLEYPLFSIFFFSFSLSIYFFKVG